MNIMILAAATQSGAAPIAMLGDSCALFLFVSGAVSMAIAGYLLYKAPKTQPVRAAARRY